MLAYTKLAVTIDPSILLKLERLGEFIEFKPNETIFNAGDKADYLYINIKGNIYLHLKNRKAWIGPGDILGEIGYILDTPRTTSASSGDTGRGALLGVHIESICSMTLLVNILFSLHIY